MSRVRGGVNASEPADGSPAPARSREAGRGNSRLSTILGATAAALASAGLAYWIGAAKDPTLGAPSVTADVPASKAYASVKADATEIIRAHERLKDVYADGGPTSVARFGQACSGRLAARPQDLDFCIAFKAFSARLDATKVVGGAPDDLALVRAALPPGQDAEGRLAQIRLLAREVSLKDRPVPASESTTATAAKTPAKVDPSRPKAAAAARARAACRRGAPAAAPTVCGAPALRNADVKLRAAYRRAAAAGVNPSMLGREQRQFRRAVQNAAPDRAAVARLYARRIRALEAQARAR